MHGKSIRLNGHGSMRKNWKDSKPKPAGALSNLPVIGSYILMLFVVGWVWNVRAESRSINERLSATLEVESPYLGLTTLYFIFQRRDCTDALAMIRTWNTLHGSGRVRVQGILFDPPQDSAARHEVIQAAGIDFPVSFSVPRSLNRIVSDLGYNRTPVSIFVDPQGQVRLTLPGAAGMTVSDAHELLRVT